MTAIERAFHDELRSELRERGFDVFDVDATFEELSLNPDRDADWYVQIIPEQGETVDDVDYYGGIGVGGRHADVTLGLLVSRIAAEANVYRGRTLELIATESLKKRTPRSCRRPSALEDGTSLRRLRFRSWSAHRQKAWRGRLLAISRSASRPRCASSTGLVLDRRRGLRRARSRTCARRSASPHA
jgi:hypothetical protein